MSLVVFSFLWLWVNSEAKYINQILDDLETPSNKSFGVIQEHQSSGNKFTIQVADEWGRVHEVSESVDETTSRKFRVGDSVPVYRKTGFVFGKKTLIANIIDNERLSRSLQTLENILLLGIAFFSVTLTISLLVRLFNKPE